MKAWLVNCRRCFVGFYTKEWGKALCDRCEKAEQKHEGLPTSEAIIIALGLVGVIVGFVLAHLYLLR